MKSFFSVGVPLIGILLALTLVHSSAIAAGTTDSGDTLKTFAGIGIGQENFIYTSANGRETHAIIQYGKQLNHNVSIGGLFGYGYNSNLNIRDLRLGGFVEFAPKDWFFYGRFYMSAIRFEDTSGSSLNLPYKGGSSTGFGPGIGIGTTLFKTEGFRVTPEVKYEIFRAEKNPTAFGLTVSIVGDL